jgi:uncharacterized low-complexity protein
MHFRYFDISHRNSRIVRYLQGATLPSTTELMIMSNKIVKPLALAIGTTLIGSLSLAQIAAANPSFHIASLTSGYALATAGEGKCGEGKCSVAKMAKPGETAVTKEEAMAHGFSESQFKAWDKDANGKLETNELAAMHAVVDAPKKGKEGSCSADKKGKEGSCSH